MGNQHTKFWLLIDLKANAFVREFYLYGSDKDVVLTQEENRAKQIDSAHLDMTKRTLYGPVPELRCTALVVDLLNHKDPNTGVQMPRVDPDLD